MARGRTFLRIGLLAALAFLGAGATRYCVAAEIRLFTAGAFYPVVETLLPQCEKSAGHRVLVQNDTAGRLKQRIDSGEQFDVAVLTASALADVAKSEKIEAGSIAALAKVKIALAVREGAPHPDIGSLEAFKTALLNAKSIAYVDPAAGGTSGIFLQKLFERLGIAGELKPKSILVPGGLVLEKVVRGQAEIGMQQTSEILAVKGVSLVGPLPEGAQSATIYSGAIAANARDPAAARALLDCLAGPDARNVLARKGLEP